MKKVSVVGIVGVPANYGGFETLVENLLVPEDNFHITVFCSALAYSERTRTYKTARLEYLPLKANGLQSIPYDIVSMIKSVINRSDVVLILGVSGAVAIPFMKLFSNAKIITNIDGIEWKRGKWGGLARWFLRLSEKIAVRFSDVVVADNKSISEYVVNEYGIVARTIAYGGDHAINKTALSIIEKTSDYFLSLCRVEPENNVDLILEAFKGGEQCIKFIGNWQASEFGRELKKAYSKEENIELIDPIYDIDELVKFRGSCIAYIHGHSAGGTNPSLVEMMHFGKPIIAYDCTFNRATTDGLCDYFTNSNSLRELLVTYRETGVEMKRIAQDRYTWANIRDQYFALFEG